MLAIERLNRSAAANGVAFEFEPVTRQLDATRFKRETRSSFLLSTFALFILLLG